MDSGDARNWRDVAIGCAGRLASCAGFIRERLADPLARECLVACGHAIVDLGAVIDRIAMLFPELKLTDSERESIESVRASRSTIAPDDNPRTRLLLDIGATEDRVLTIQRMAPELASDLANVIKSLGVLAKLIDEKVPGPR